MDHVTLFLEDTPLAGHHTAQEQHRAGYCAALLVLLAQGLELSAATRARGLAAAWARRDADLADHLLAHPQWDLTAVARAVQLLDAPRKARVLRRRIDRLATDGRTRPQRLGTLRSQVNDLEREALPPNTGSMNGAPLRSALSMSGALARRVRRWVRTLPADKLAYYALAFPLAPWRELADLCHLAPADFQLPWFLPVAFGAAPPEGSALAACAAAQPADLPALAARHRVPYSALRSRLPSAEHPEALREAVAGYESLDTLLWYYEELRGPATDARITAAIAAGEAPGFGYGKLMERLFALRDLRAPCWKQLVTLADRQAALFAAREDGAPALAIDAPVVVLGDASSSMTVAIRVATIIGSVLTVLTRADLRFFNQELLQPPRVPRTIDDVLQVADVIRATGTTAPAAALWPSLKRREVVRSLLVVTDEEENTACQGLRFDAMLARYREDVHPAQVVFLSFLGDQRQPGQMVSALRARGVPCRQFRLDARRPDLTKLDEILAHLSLGGARFRERLAQATERCASEPLALIAAQLQAPAPDAAAPSPEGPAEPQGLWRRLRSFFRGAASSA